MLMKNLFLKYFNLDFVYKKSLGEDVLKNVFLNSLNNKTLNEELSQIVKSEVLVSGCSFTNGNALDEKYYAWPYQLEKKLNIKIANLARSGASISGSISRIFDYIKIFGNPKVILCLFPDPFRGYLPNNKNSFISDFPSDKNKNNDEFFLDDIGFVNINCSVDKYTMPNYSALPHQVQDVLPIEISVFLSIQQIKFLEAYCNAADIKLVYGSWEYDTHNLIQILKNISNNQYFDSYVSVADFGLYTWHNDIEVAKRTTQFTIFKDSVWSGSKDEIDLRIKMIKEFRDDESCHKYLRDTDLNTFHIANDNRHWGSHSQAHLADYFYEKIKDLI